MSTEKTLIESEQCFDFVFRGFQFLQDARLATITAVKVPRTIVNIYASNISTLPFDASVAQFFASERRVLTEWVKLSGEVPVPFTGHYTAWYWPAWYSPTEYAAGTGKLLQDTDYPQTYHKYKLAWPKTSKSPSTAHGVHRVAMPIVSSGQQEALLV